MGLAMGCSWICELAILAGVSCGEGVLIVV